MRRNSRQSACVELREAFCVVGVGGEVNEEIEVVRCTAVALVLRLRE